MTDAEQKTNANTNTKPIEYNPRWKGYVYIALTSLINFSSIANIQVVAEGGLQRGSTLASMSYGFTTFVMSILILIQDRSQKCIDPFHYTKSFNGLFEGYTLLFCVLWWIVGVAYITKVDGIAYVANNIYYTAWLCLFSSIYTLNKWSTSKDILSISELTGVSSTLKSWYVVLLSSLVVLGTCVDLHSHLDKESREDASFGVALGTVSSIVALFFILVHYNFIKLSSNNNANSPGSTTTSGGWLELSSSFFLIMLWIIGLAILTRDQGIGATLSGTKCGRRNTKDKRGIHFFDDSSCVVVVKREVINETAVGLLDDDEIDLADISSSDLNDIDLPTMIIEEAIACTALGRQVPGSNLYFAAWTAFIASLNITFRWKADQAMQFAQAHAATRQQTQNDTNNSNQQGINNNNDFGGDDANYGIDDADSENEDDEHDEDAI